MIQFLCVVRFEDGEFFCDVPSIQPFVDLGLKVETDETDREGQTKLYTVTFNENTPLEIDNFKVTSWENVHPSDWSKELIQLNDSYV